MPTILLKHLPARRLGVFERDAAVGDGIWLRLKSHAAELDPAAILESQKVELAWRHALFVLQMMSRLQTQLGFAFDTDASSEALVQRFLENFRSVRRAANSLVLNISEAEVRERLEASGWDMASHPLRPYQMENLRALLSLQHGANFSVPGAGKTTVTFALHLLTATPGSRLLVVAPRNAFMAWEEVIDECLLPDAPQDLRMPFVSLVGGETNIVATLEASPRRMLISYQQMIRVESVINELVSVNRVHLVVDESHKMKGGIGSRSGAVLLQLGDNAVRRDILSGTPMPQKAGDMESQLDFLWPSVGLGARISAGEAPRRVLGQLHVRTTKQQLGLGERTREPVLVTLTDAHLAFYAVLKSAFVAMASQMRRGRLGVDLIRARRSVMKILEASVNPAKLATELLPSAQPGEEALLRAVIAEGASARVRTAVDLARALAASGQKTLIWTGFRSTLQQLVDLLVELEPAVICGDTGVGSEEDEATRQGQIRRFKTDPNCKVMVANPAAASEGMSLHMVCHDAIYVDRSYNAAHYLQSIDRIHRLGLPAGTLTRLHVLQNRLSAGVDSVDVSVARRLEQKIRAMEDLLGDPDLRQLALDEESVVWDVEDAIDRRDIEDLLSEIERPTSTVESVPSV